MGVEPEDEFVSDDQLKTLLDRWIAPDQSADPRTAPRLDAGSDSSGRNIRP